MSRDVHTVNAAEVAEHVINNCQCARLLQVYALPGGTQLAAFDIHATLSQHWGSHLPMILSCWSLSSSQISFRGIPCVDFGTLEAAAADASPVAICNLDGSLTVLPDIPKSHEHAVSWSADGTFVHVDCWGSSTKKASRGSIWHAATGTKVYSWKYDGLSIPGSWSPKGSHLFLPSCRTLVSLPTAGISTSGDTKAAIKLHPWDGPEMPAWNPKPGRPRDPSVPAFVYAPSGKVVVGAWQGSPGPGAPGPSRAVQPRRPFRLWHIHTDPADPACMMTAAATSNTWWLMKTVAWHPGPRLAHIYAIASACGSVHLMDRKQNRCAELSSHTGRILMLAEDACICTAHPSR